MDNIPWKKQYEDLVTEGKKKGALLRDTVARTLQAAGAGDRDVQQALLNLHDQGVKIVQKTATREWVESIVVAFILAMFIREFFFQAFRIPSGSMRNTLLEGDRLLVNKLYYGPKIRFTPKRLPGFTTPQRGDVIVFIYPQDEKRDFIKRLIALGGETVEIKDGDIYVDGKLVEDPRIKNIYYYNYGNALPGEKIRVPEGHYFVLGDNSASSSDSRYWGFVPENNVIGKAALIYWPPQRIRIIK
ncbi:MAG TPA: signal peptidase I [Candidatus Omnitrophota bacterium]|nr:signal peptidase I [Candidatus Omnitrophota bacterium]HQO58464.1 signal peptidase I [Candidatus Omnitrophota bacterium]HQP12039.1 signal peptidase I [Candidatus Omnitrophota bacterium]